MNFARLIPLAVLAAPLAACGGDAPQEGEVTGEVLEGTISDDMLPLDQVRSEAPLADPTGTGASGAAAAGSAGADDGETGTEEEPDEPAQADE